MTHYSIPTTVHTREFDGERIVLDLDAGQYFGLNGVGAAIWALLEKGRSCAEVVQILHEEYGVELEDLSRDVDRFVGELRAKGLIVETSGEPNAPGQESLK
jgi:hypothetical protein